MCSFFLSLQNRDMEIKEKNKLIRKINSLLLKKFGKPYRSGKLPEPVDLLIATILSQNTNDTNSYKAYQNLKQKFPEWKMLLNVPVSKIEKEIKIAGLGKQKATAIKNFVESLYHERKNLKLDFLRNSDDLTAIKKLTGYKGIGVKTASCVLLFAFDKDVCPVDTHVHRTVNRLGIVEATTPDKTFFLLNENFPKGIAHSFHTNLIRLGREICKPKNPACGICPLKRICTFPGKNFNGNSSGKSGSFMLLDNV